MSKRPSDLRSTQRLRDLLTEMEVRERMREHPPMKGGPCGNWVDALRLFLKGKLHR